MNHKKEFYTRIFYSKFDWMKIQIINGPNLNLLGVREPGIYGNQGFDTYINELRDMYSIIEIDYFQSNVEGELINKLHEVGFSYDGIVINAGGYTHTSVAIADAIAAIKTPVIEVHISNIYAREEYRHVSLTGKNCKGVLTGFGMDGYRLAIESLLKG
jgi:3-dehydroquinate dehydratase-2